MNRRAPMIAGIAFAVLYAAAVVVLHALPGSDPGVLRVQALLLIFAALALAVLLAFARDQLGGPPAHLFTIGSTLLVAQMCVAIWFTGGASLRPNQVPAETALAIEDVRFFWLPTATIAAICVAVPILLWANEDRLPRWLGTGAAIFTVEQLIETITIIGPPGSFISPGGPMNHYLGGTLTAAFFLGLGIALSQQGDRSIEPATSAEPGTADEGPEPEPADAAEPEAATEPVGER
ncbi:hypothetical protein ACEWX3_11035 [Mycobacterium sp. G7A2]|uniref:hypothetical protein n=1 Tax=Mycobacteriaceae TaxID=1762 RepID=UPI0035A844DA